LDVDGTGGGLIRSVINGGSIIIGGSVIGGSVINDTC
jgi:hypothetical protein